MKLFEDVLQKNREKLDVATGDKIFKLQGQNELLKMFLQAKVKRDIKYSDHDGGFGV